MSHPRMKPVEPPYASPVAQLFERAMPPGMEPLNLFRTMAHNPRVLQRMFAGNLLDEGSIAMREREIVILRTCARCKSEYEWGVHIALFSKQAKLSAAAIAATLDDKQGSGELSDREAILMKVVDELHDTSTLSDGSWAELAEHYAPAQILEIIALTGYYHTISFMTNALRVDHETYAPRFIATAELTALSSHV